MCATKSRKTSQVKLFLTQWFVLKIFADCDSGYTEYGGKCYRYSGSEEKEWDDAKAACIAEGGNLATIDDQAENDFLVSMIG